MVDVVGTPKALEDFPGLYVGALPELPFLGMPASWSVCLQQERNLLAITQRLQQVPSVVPPCTIGHTLMQMCS